MTRPRLKCLRPTLAPAPVNGWKPDEVRGSRHQRGYGWEWEKTVKRIKARAEGLCEHHLKQDIVHLGTECDHIIPKARGGTDDDSNLQWICGEYHREKTARESRGGGSE